MRYLLESLIDLNSKLVLRGGCLYMLCGNPVNIFKRIKEEIGLNLITFEQVIIYIYIMDDVCAQHRRGHSCTFFIVVRIATTPGKSATNW